MSNHQKYLSAVANDIASAFKIPGASLLAQAVQDVFERRLSSAREILIEELKSGDKDISEVYELDEIAAITYRYMRAAQEGSARINLRLLASVIAGQREHQVLRADDFLYYADIISSLKKEEIILLGTFYKYLGKLSPNSLTIRHNPHLTNKDEHLRIVDALRRAKHELIPTIFEDEIDLVSTAAAAARTGLIYSMAAAIGGEVFVITPLFEKLYVLAPLHIALSKEGFSFR